MLSYNRLENMFLPRIYAVFTEPVAMITVDNQTESWYYYHTDALGSVVALSNSVGVLAESYKYSPFGKAFVYDAAGSYTGESSAYGNPYMFTARRYDPETGLYYYRARMYSPTLGRFLQTDPLGYYDSMNLYQYCSNNPVYWIDPLGLSEWKWFDGGWGTAFDLSIVGTYFHFWYDQGANIRDFGIWLATGMDKAKKAGEKRRDQMEPGVIQDPGAEGVKNLCKDAADATLDMPGTLTGGPLGVPDSVGDAAGVTATVINEAVDKCRGGSKNDENEE